MDAVRTQTGADGTFAFNNVAPGDYVVQAMTTDRTGPSANVAVARQFAAAVVTVAGDEPPPLDLKLMLFDLAKFFKGAWLEVAEEGALLRAKGQTAPLLSLGEAIDLVVDRRDEANKRWVFEPKKT